MKRVMYGRYGADQLGFALIGCYLAFYILSLLTRGKLLSLLSTLCLILAFYRTFSRQIERRRAENERFLESVRPIVRWYNVRKCRRQDRDHCYFRCPNCGQQLRAPKGKGKISVTCRSCGATFEKKT
ncbi:MAG: hypothetical protein PUC36_06410 [Clostridiales bacterium]|nr:hypothetical protein [Clostridiales bacterium]